MASTQYNVTVKNNANAPWKFYVFQSPPAITNDLTLAWFASPFHIAPGDMTTFSWNTNYQFVWSATGEVKPGITFKATGSKEGDPQVKNQTKFTFVNDTPDLSDPTTGGPQGSLTIHDGDTVPPKTFAVGVGMSGNGTYVVNAGPNLVHQFTPTPAYYVAAIEEVEEGQVMDIKTITETGDLKFPPNVYSLTATLKADNTWDVQPSSKW